MDKDKFIEKIKYFLPIILTLLFISGVIVASNVINNINRVEVEFTNIDVQKEFQKNIPSLNITGPGFVVVDSRNATTNPNGDLVIAKNNLIMGNYTGMRILIPLNIQSDVKNQPNSFFVPDFIARIEGGEKVGEKDNRLRADWRLLLKSKTGCAGENQIQGVGFCLQDIGIGGKEWMALRMYRPENRNRKQILFDYIKRHHIANKRNYTIVLEVIPNFAPIMNNQIPDFSIIIENIRPVLKN